MSKLHSLLVTFCVLTTYFTNAQQITVNSSLSAQELIENNLVEGCVEVSNISSSVNGSVNNLNSFGYFEQSGSNFPFQNGIIISTGEADSAGNATNTNTLNEGEDNWGTDPDLETALGLSNTLNATSIEFIFTSISNQIQFNYILASEEYYGNFPCEYSDGFAFLIKPAGTATPFTNIAVIPGTTTPVNTSTIHSEVVGFCAAENEAFFEGYNIGDTNYNGRTKVLTATATIIPNVQYHIKLIIADQTDENYDSAVLIEGNSFNATVNLGEDITTCASNILLNGDIENPNATYAWYANGTLLNGENNPTLSVTQTANYTVEVTIPLNNTTCVIEDSAMVTLSSEQSADPISDYEVCDDASGDETEWFDLSTKNTDVLAAVPSGNYSISYHTSQNNAENNQNAINAPIQNTSNPQQIFVRIEDTDTGCLAYATFNLVVNPLPEIIDPTPLDICDDEIDDGFREIDLTVKNDEITNNQSNLNVSYHYTQNDADTNQNAIISPYINTTQTEVLVVRIENPQTGCVSTTNLTVNVLDNPELASNFIQIDACDDDHDGYDSFDLNAALAEIIQGLNDVSTSFHLNYEDALTGANPLNIDLNSFDNTIPDVQNLYVHVQNDNTGCSNVATIELHTNLLLTGTSLQDFTLCDDDSNNGQEIFDLVAIETTILNNIPDSNIIFYTSQNDLDNQTNPLDETIDFTNSTNPQTLFITIENQNCVEQAEVELYVNPPLLIQPIGPQDYCDTDDDGFTSIDLTIYDEAVSNNTLDVNTVAYFISEPDAENDQNALPNYYTNVNNPEIIYARITNTATSCYDVTSFQINVIPAPTVTNASDIVICDDDQDAISTVNLDAKIPEIITNTSNVIISFHESLAYANDNTNAISNSQTFTTASQTIFTRIESTITGCFAIATIGITINTLPIFMDIEDYQICESDGDQTAEFTFNTKDAEILNGQTGKVVLYFETQQDANNSTNRIDKNNVYSNTTSPQTIYVRVENTTDQYCFGTSEFTIIVDPVPNFNAPLDWFICDDASNDGVHEFDLNEKINEISENISQNIDVTFYTSFENAELSANPISTTFTNTQNPQQLFARIENGLSCYAIAEFGLNVIQAPETNSSVPLVVCDDNYDGISIFDLSISEFDVLNVRQNEIEVTYYETETDLEAQTNQIQDPENYSNLTNNQTVYIRVTNTTSTCYVSIPLVLNVNLPPTTNVIEAINICEEDTGIYDFAYVTNLLVDDTTNLTINYFNSQVDAENNENSISTEYPYQPNTNTIYSRVENNTTGCFVTTSFSIIVNPNPVANTPQDLEACDDDADEISEFDLSDNTAQILGNQNPANYTVTYYESNIDSVNAENALNQNYAAYNEQTIYVRVENNATGCFAATQFVTIVHPLPIVDIEDTLTICLEDLPLIAEAETGNSGDTYLWSTNQTTPQIEIASVGDYWITITTPFGCETTKEFSVIESEQAMINAVETIDFSDPNNITITVSGIGDYLYILDDGEPQESNIFEYVSLGYHTITIIDLNGCSDITKEVIVIDAPKFFTPNNDGYFDTWHITGVETLPGTVVYIFDRYGKLLKTLTHTSQGWNGTYNGSKMPVTDYWYLAKVQRDNKAFEVKGNFTLKR